jgi:hypothetical protein
LRVYRKQVRRETYFAKIEGFNSLYFLANKDAETLQMLNPGEQILFTRQRHEAKRMGLHWDYRLVAGDKAYSWSTKKEMPEPGKAIVLFEQPVHTAHYALSEKVEIPDGQYGAGTTYLEFAQKARIGEASTPEQLTLYTAKHGKFLLKKLDPTKYGDKAWLFKRLNEHSEGMRKEAQEARPEFAPDLTPEQMEQLGVLAERYFDTPASEGNFFKVTASMKEWPQAWHNDQHPLGWYQWYKGYASGKRTDDDARQIKRWTSFKARHLAQLKAADPTLTNLSVQPRRRQALLNWGIAPGIEVNRYLQKAQAIKMDSRKEQVQHVRKS